MQRVLIDYLKFPVIQDRIGGFYQIGQERKDALKQFNQVMDRVEGIMKFLYHFSPENNPATKKAYLRAALSEFVSIEEVLIQDLEANKIIADVLKINATQNPLFHILKQLRNYNIHLGISGLNYSDPNKVIWGSKDSSRKWRITRI